jgi:hypothetical protein
MLCQVCVLFLLKSEGREPEIGYKPSVKIVP